MSAIRISELLLIGFGAALVAAPAQQPSQPQREILTKCLHDENCAMRFLFEPPDLDHVVPAAIFRVAREKDHRYGTWTSNLTVGDTIWIGPEEMQKLVTGLEELSVTWIESPTPREFKEELNEHPLIPEMPYKIPRPSGRGMEIDVSCDAGSAETDLAREKICNSMEHLDRDLQTPIAVLLFRSFRDNWGCKVPGFDAHTGLPKPITGPEAAILVYLVPIARELRSNGSDIDWEWETRFNLPGINWRDYYFYFIYKGPRKAKGSVPIGRFAVNQHTADVWDLDSRKLVQSREIGDVQTALRREHYISTWWIEQYRNVPLEDGGK